MLTVDITLPQRGKELRQKLSHKEITMEDFMLECYYWLLSTIDELRHRPLPTMPEILRDYYNKKADDRAYTVAPGFWRIASVEAYLNQASAINAQNRGNKWWLMEMERHIPEADIKAHYKIKEVLRGY